MVEPIRPEGGWLAASLPERRVSRENGEAQMVIVNGIAQSELFLTRLWSQAELLRVFATVRPEHFEERARVALGAYRLVRDGGLTYELWSTRSESDPLLALLWREYDLLLRSLLFFWFDEQGIGAMSSEACFYYFCDFWLKDEKLLTMHDLSCEQAMAMLNPHRER